MFSTNSVHMILKIFLITYLTINRFVCRQNVPSVSKYFNTGMVVESKAYGDWPQRQID